ncbi:MAG: hypothetical protein ACREF6_14655, partial [Alphaproteobacteria bacterium]
MSGSDAGAYSSFDKAMFTLTKHIRVNYMDSRQGGSLARGDLSHAIYGGFEFPQDAQDLAEEIVKV